MKKISEHLGQIIAVLASIALVIGVIGTTGAEPISKFFGTIISTSTEKGNSILGSLENPNASHKMLEGDGLTYVEATPVAARFRSSADFDKFKEVKVDGAVVDASNYSVSSGSTVVVFTNDYMTSLAGGAHTVEIVSNNGVAKAAFKVVEGNKIPEGGTYTAADGTVYKAYDSFPDTMTEGDKYQYGDYEYCYGYSYCDCMDWSTPDGCGCEHTTDGWGVRCVNDVAEPGPILESINNQPITSVRCAFYECSSLTTAPAIPGNVTSMVDTFTNCSSLTTAPTIPNSVTDLSFTFYECSSLTTAPAIPSSVTDMAQTFYGCKNLTGTVEIPCHVDVDILEWYYCPATVEYYHVDDCVRSHNGIIPEGGTYTQSASAGGAVLTAGDYFPETVTGGDRYTFGDYIYQYQSIIDIGWQVKINTNVTDKNQTKYGKILESINGEPVTRMDSTFSECTNLTTAPLIPNSVTSMERTFSLCSSLINVPSISSSVTNMNYTFSGCSMLTKVPAIPSSVTSMYETFKGCTNLTKISDLSNCSNLKSMTGTFSGCTSLTTAPTIPNSVTSMYDTFNKCTSLTTAPTIPNSVTSMSFTFSRCTSLTGNITINASPASGSRNYCFNGVDFNAQNLTLTGDSTILDELGATGTNYCAECNGKCNGGH